MMLCSGRFEILLDGSPELINLGLSPLPVTVANKGL